MTSRYDTVVIGGGHAGIEAAHASARLGARTAMVSMDVKAIGRMSCNPAIGGVAKGQLVRDLDALGGLMGVASDIAGIQFRMLNLSKGPAVWGPRAQMDMELYADTMQSLLRATPNLDLLDGELEDFRRDADGVFHLELFHDPDTGELTFGECAARRGGGLIHEEIQAKFNVHLGECALLCALGRRPPIEAKVRPGVVASGYLPGRAGLLVDCPTPAELRELPGVEFARIESCPGSPSAEGAGTTSERIGMVLVAADTAEAADVRLAEVREWFAERLLVAPSGPPRAQRAWQKAAWPDHDFGDVLWH